MKSDPPPGVKPTTIFTGFTGYCCAAAAPTASDAISTASQVAMLFIFFLRFRGESYFPFQSPKTKALRVCVPTLVRGMAPAYTALARIRHGGGVMSGSILQGIVRMGLLALLASQASPAAAGAPHRFVVFGDSLSDPGNAFVLVRDVEVPPFDNLIPDAPYARGALHFSNGATWVEQLSVLDQALPSTGPALLHPVLFSNYAVGGAHAQPVGLFDLSTQVSRFLSDFDRQAPADALYIVFVGGNDLRDALDALVQDPTFGTSLGIVGAAVTAIQSNLLTLHAAGARSFLVANAPA